MWRMKIKYSLVFHVDHTFYYTFTNLKAQLGIRLANFFHKRLSFLCINLGISPYFCTFSFNNVVAGLAHIMRMLGMLNQEIYFLLHITLE